MGVWVYVFVLKIGFSIVKSLVYTAEKKKKKKKTKNERFNCLWRGE
jgi:hypothetical protein